MDPPGTQYQAGDGQYQPPAGSDDGDFGDGTDDDTELDPCQQEPVVVPGAEATPAPASDTSDASDAVTPASEPAGPEATAATGQPPGSASSVSSSPPPADARPAEAVADVTAKGPVETAVEVVPAGAVLGEVIAAGQGRLRQGAVTRSARPVRPKISAPMRVRRPERAVAVPAGVSTPVAGSRSPSGRWFAFAAAALLAFGLSSVALLAGVRPRASVLGGVRARIGSRGLSSEAPFFPAPGSVSRGIRYRD